MKSILNYLKSIQSKFCVKELLAMAFLKTSKQSDPKIRVANISKSSFSGENSCRCSALMRVRRIRLRKSDFSCAQTQCVGSPAGDK
jgi:hypothetical protein